MSELSTAEIRAKIRQLTRVNLKTAGYETIKSVFDSMLPGLLTEIKMTSGGELFYRARIGCEKPNIVRQMMSPPAECVRSYQRCNAPGDPMFYSASKRATALLECGAKAGDTAYLGQWIGRQQIPINNIFYMSNDVGGHEISPKQDVILTFFETLFTRRIDKAFSDDYKLTAALTTILAGSFLGDNPFNIGADGRAGLRYPSVAHIDGGYNTAFYPEFAEERLEFLHLMEIKIADVSGENFAYEVADTAYVFDDGIIKWTGKPDLIPVPLSSDKHGVLFKFDGEKWRIQVRDTAPSPDDLAFLLFE